MSLVKETNITLKHWKQCLTVSPLTDHLWIFHLLYSCSGKKIKYVFKSNTFDRRHVIQQRERTNVGLYYVAVVSQAESDCVDFVLWAKVIGEYRSRTWRYRQTERRAKNTMQWTLTAHMTEHIQQQPSWAQRASCLFLMIQNFFGQSHIPCTDQARYSWKNELHLSPHVWFLRVCVLTNTPHGLISSCVLTFSFTQCQHKSQSCANDFFSVYKKTTWWTHF